MPSLDPGTTLPNAIAHLIGLELQDERSPWHNAFPGSIELAQRYRVSQRTIISALTILRARGLMVKRSGRYISVQQRDRPENRLIALAADLAAAINDRTLTGRLPIQREIAHRHRTEESQVSRAITLLVQQGFVNSDHRTVAAHPPASFAPPELERRRSRSNRARQPYRKVQEQRVFSPTQLIVNGIIHEHPAGLHHSDIQAPEDITDRYGLSVEAAGDVYFDLLDQYGQRQQPTNRTSYSYKAFRR